MNNPDKGKLKRLFRLGGLERFFLLFWGLFILNLWIIDYLSTNSIFAGLRFPYFLHLFLGLACFWISYKAQSFILTRNGKGKVVARWVLRFVFFAVLFIELLAVESRYLMEFASLQMWQQILIAFEIFLGLSFLMWLFLFTIQWAMDRSYPAEALEKWIWRMIGILLGFVISITASVLSQNIVALSIILLTGFFSAEINNLFTKLTEKDISHRPDEVKIMGIRIDNMTQGEGVKEIGRIIDGTQDTGPLNLVVTPYSEYFIKAKRDEDFKKVLNGAELSLPDGIFSLWAASFSSMPIKMQNPILRAFGVVIRYVFSGMAIILYPKFTRRVVKERVSGSEIVYPLMEMAAEKGYEVFFLGGYDWGRGNAGTLAAEKLKEHYPNLNIVEVYPGERNEETREEALELINKFQPDLLLTCFGGGSGERWMYENRSKLKAKVGIGLGGTFDFIAGYAGKVHPTLGKLGLEWFLRPLSRERGGLISNVQRAYRVWRGMLLSSIMLLLERLNYKQRT